MSIKDQRGISTFRGVSIILIEIVVVVFVFYFLYYFWIENPVPTSNIFIVRAFKGEVIEIPESVNTTGWEIYENENYNFGISYPAHHTMTQDVITYNETDGTVFALSLGDTEMFYLRVFNILPKETVADTYERITGISPSIYQSYSEKVDGTEATVYRQRAGEDYGDRIYFIGEGFMFESVFDQFAAEILSTFRFIK